MKRLLLVALMPLAALLPGCGKGDQSSPSSSSASAGATNAAPGLAATAVNVVTNQQQSAGAMLEQYGHTLATAKKKALTKTDLITVDRAIQSFQADRGRNPSSLEELIQEGFLPKLPDLPLGKKYSYNPQSGEVDMVDAN